MKTLEVSSVGDRRFSALYAKISVCGKVDSIENHYQLSKVFRNVVTGETDIHFNTFKEVKQAQRNRNLCLVGFKLKGKLYDKTYLTVWYKALWYKYFLYNRQLIDVLKQYDNFTDKFTAKNTVNSQADICKIISTGGIEALYSDVSEFLVMSR